MDNRWLLVLKFKRASDTYPNNQGVQVGNSCQGLILIIRLILLGRGFLDYAFTVLYVTSLL